MIDRFKFRVWDKEKNEMECDLYDEPGDMQISCVNEVFKDYLSNNRHIVEQCTGLKDKNGSLIYEGDIVKAFGFKDSYILVCRFRDGSFCLDHVDGRPYNFIHSVAPVEVIGNIHENPELLED